MIPVKMDSDLLWAAKAVFSDPSNLGDAQNINDLDLLLQWADEQHIAGASALAAALNDGSLDLDQLNTDYTGLFVNGFPTAKAHPFAGWYLGEGVLFGAEDRRLRKFYSQYGVLIEDELVQADHILVELEFMALMCAEYIRTGEHRCYQALVEMTDNHMSGWIFAFLDDIHVKAESEFYRVLASVLTRLFDDLFFELKGVA